MRHSITVYSENCSHAGMPVPVGRAEEFGDESPDFVTYEWSSRDELRLLLRELRSREVHFRNRVRECIQMVLK